MNIARIQIFYRHLRHYLLIFCGIITIACSTTIPPDMLLGNFTKTEFIVPSRDQNNLFDVVKFELEDFKVPPTRSLSTKPWVRATPLSIPGGKLITTNEINNLLSSTTPSISPSIPPLIIDVRSADDELITVKGAHWLNGAGFFYNEPNLDEIVVSRLLRDLNTLTNSDKNRILIFMCANPICVLSYNAALRAIKDDYTNVFWYRGGIEAWANVGGELTRQVYNNPQTSSK